MYEVIELVEGTWTVVATRETRDEAIAECSRIRRYAAIVPTVAWRRPV